MYVGFDQCTSPDISKCPQANNPSPNWRVRLAETVKSYFRVYSILQIQSVKYMMTILYYPCNSSLTHLSTSEEGILMTNQRQDVYGPEKGDLRICNYTICLPIVKQLMITHTLHLLGIDAYLGLKIKRWGKDKLMLD